MRRLIIPVACLALLVVGLAATPAFAATAKTMLFPYDVNLLEDQDWELLATGGAPELVKGNILVGMLEIGSTENLTGPGAHNAALNGATFTGVFVLQYTGETILLEGGTATWHKFAPVSGWNTLAALDIFDLPAVSDGTIALIVDNPNYDAFNAQFVDPETGDAADSLATALDGTKLWELGFTGAVGADEFWYSTNVTFPPSNSLTFYGSLNVTENYPGAPGLLPHDYLYTLGGGQFLGLGAVTSQVQLRGGFQGTDPLDNFDLDTDTDFWIVPTPEPGSIALLGLGLLGIGGAVYRRRRNK